ncbi:MAG: hypothetical protein QNJ31_03015 [Candidatus Caenarcaniphilales bacterium]|nr:hypothetical protein [Candidatus Caenarcaniphilales bacterium]
MLRALENTKKSIEALVVNRAKGPVERLNQAKQVSEDYFDNPKDKPNLLNLPFFGFMRSSKEIDTFYRNHEEEIRGSINAGHDPFKNANLPKDLSTEEEKVRHLASEKTLSEMRMTGVNQFFTSLFAIQSMLSVVGAGWGFFSDKENAGHHLTSGIMNAAQMFLFPWMAKSKDPKVAIIGNFLAMLGMQFVYPILDKLLDGFNQQPAMAYSPYSMKGGGPLNSMA